MIKFFFFFTSISSYAQIINIPDANFKAELLAAHTLYSNPSTLGYQIAQNSNDDYVTIDTNNDGEIEQSEALAIYRLGVGGGFPINDLTGIECFINLKYFSCYNQPVTSINLATLTNLISLQLINSGFTQLYLTGLTHLEDLACWQNNQLTSLHFENNPMLNSIGCYDGNLSSLDVSNLPALATLSCQNNQLTAINIGDLQNFAYLDCNHNLLTNLDLPSMPMGKLDCSYNQLTSLIFNANIGSVYCNNNQISTANFEIMTLLRELDCSHNQLTGLDLNNNQSPIYPFTLRCSYNNLMDIKIKNGFFQEFNTYWSWAHNPNLSTICADDFEIQALRSFLSFNGYNLQNLTINSNCNLNNSSFDNSASVKVEPNPSNGNLVIKFDNLQEKVIVSLSNIFGQIVSSKTVTSVQTINYNISGNNGLYFLAIENQNGEKKIVKVIKE